MRNYYRRICKSSACNKVYSSLCHPCCRRFSWFIVRPWLGSHGTISAALCSRPGDSRSCPPRPRDKLAGEAPLLLTWELALWLPKKEGPLYSSPWEDPDLLCVTPSPSSTLHSCTPAFLALGSGNTSDFSLAFRRPAPLKLFLSRREPEEEKRPRGTGEN